MAKALHDGTEATRPRVKSTPSEFEKNEDGEVCKGMFGEFGGVGTKHLDQGKQTSVHDQVCLRKMGMFKKLSAGF